MIVESVWVTTEDHLQRFSGIVGSTGLSGKMISGFKMPDGFPQVKIPGRVIPLVYLAQGYLKIDHSGLAFTAEPPVPWPGAAFLNTADDAGFVVQREQIVEIKRFDLLGAPKPYSINWIELRYILGENVAEVLLCTGARGLLMKNINPLTDKLYGYLEVFAKE